SLQASFTGQQAAVFPALKADFNLTWGFNDTNPQDPLGTYGEAPTLWFDNVRLELGSFLSNLVGPFLKDLQTVTKPLQPFIDVLKARLPIVSDLSKLAGLGDNVSLLSLAGIDASAGNLSPDVERALRLGIALSNTIDAVNQINASAG